MMLMHEVTDTCEACCCCCCCCSCCCCCRHHRCSRIHTPSAPGTTEGVSQPSEKEIEREQKTIVQWSQRISGRVFFFFAWLCLSLGMPSKKIAIAAHTKSVKNTGTFQKPVCPDLSCRLSPKVSVFVAPFCLEQNTKRKLVFHHNCSCSACRASRPAQSH